MRRPASAPHRVSWQQAWLQPVPINPHQCLLSTLLACRFLRSWAGYGAMPPATAALDVASVVPTGRLSAAATMAALTSPALCVSPRPCPAAASPPCWHAGCSTGSAGGTGCSSRAGLHRTHCFSAPASPAGDAAATAAASAARAVESEVRSLRCARRAYQLAAVGQHELCTSVARTIHEALKQSDAPGSPAATLLRPRSTDVGIQAIGRRRKWRRDLAVELQGLCSGVGASRTAGCPGD